MKKIKEIWDAIITFLFFILLMAFAAFIIICVMLIPIALFVGFIVIFKFLIGIATGGIIYHHAF